MCAGAGVRLQCPPLAEVGCSRLPQRLIGLSSVRDLMQREKLWQVNHDVLIVTASFPQVLKVYVSHNIMDMCSSILSILFSYEAAISTQIFYTLKKKIIYLGIIQSVL